MPYADRSAQKAHLKRMATNRMAKLRAYVDELKTGPCTDCGFSFDPVCMDFDHRDPLEKTAEISRCCGRGRGGASWAKLLRELEKCDLVCSNCHRLREKVRRNARDAALATASA